MQTITVPKEKLLATLQENREAHRETFLKAQGVFRERVITALDERLQAIRDGQKIDLQIYMPEPVDYTDSYDRAIAMVEWAVGDTMELSEKDFKQFVLNDWDWGRMFAESTVSYAMQA